MVVFEKHLSQNDNTVNNNNKLEQSWTFSVLSVSTSELEFQLNQVSCPYYELHHHELLVLYREKHVSIDM